MKFYSEKDGLFEVFIWSEAEMIVCWFPISSYSGYCKRLISGTWNLVLQVSRKDSTTGAINFLGFVLTVHWTQQQSQGMDLVLHPNLEWKYPKFVLTTVQNKHPCLGNFDFDTRDLFVKCFVCRKPYLEFC